MNNYVVGIIRVGVDEGGTILSELSQIEPTLVAHHGYFSKTPNACIAS